MPNYDFSNQKKWSWENPYQPKKLENESLKDFEKKFGQPKPYDFTTENKFSNPNEKKKNKGGSNRSKTNSVLGGLGASLLSGALGKVFNKITGEGSRGGGSDVSQVAGNNAQIDLPGTLMGSLANVVNTRSYMQNFARYNNYLTSNYGLAQMASDRYMSIKERIPMSVEYYQTPTQKKEIQFYINPENMSINTAKVKQKVYTRGGIYFHHYGDDVWTMKINGTCGYAAMRGIEAFEQFYFNSGALLKYQNISAATVHTNQITSLKNQNYNGESMQSMLDSLRGSGKIGNYLGKVIGTATDALGYTGNGTNTLGQRIFGNKTSSGRSNANLFDAVSNSVLDMSNNYNKLFDDPNQSKESRQAMNTVKNLMQASQMTTGSPTAFKQYFSTVMGNLVSGIGSTSSKELMSSMAADLTLGLFGGSPRNDNTNAVMNQLNYGTKNFFGGLLGMLTGNPPTNTSSMEKYDMPLTGTSGNFYTIGKMQATELNRLVSTVQSFNQRHTIDKQLASQNWSDIEDQLTDLYRPRQIIIYFDDRVYIGHCDSFNYSRKASTLLINYDMSFTITRQIKVDPQLKSNELGMGGSGSSLGELLGTALAGRIVGNLMTPSSKKKKNKDVGTEPSKNSNQKMP